MRLNIFEKKKKRENSSCHSRDIVGRLFLCEATIKLGEYAEENHVDLRARTLAKSQFF